MVRVQGSQLTELWSGDEMLSNHYATAVHRDGTLDALDALEKPKRAESSEHGIHQGPTHERRLVPQRSPGSRARLR